MAGKQIYSITAIAFKSVFRKLFRNTVLVLAVGLLVALLVFALLFNKTIKENLEAAAKKLGADIVLVPAAAIDNAEEFILESREKTFYMDKFVYNSVMDLPGIKASTYHVYLSTLASGCCSIVDAQVVAFDQHSDFVIKPWLNNAPPLKEGQVYVGSYVYEYLGLIDTPTLFGKKVKVAAHLKKTGTGLDHGIFMRLEDLPLISATATGQYKPEKISIIFLKIKDGVDLNTITGEIQGINPTIGIMTRGNIGADVRSTLKDIIRIFSITIIISSVLAILLAWSTFTALANERKREVGVFRAIGAHRSHIIRMFLSEAMIISSIGGLLGVLIGHFLNSQLAKDFQLINRISTFSGITFENIIISFLAMITGIFICLIGAAIPIIRISRIEPLLAIKEE